MFPLEWNGGIVAPTATLFCVTLLFSVIAALAMPICIIASTDKPADNDNVLGGPC